MDIFQQWLLLRIQESFGGGTSPMENEISFEAVVALIKPIFEQEGAPLDEAEVRRNLEALTSLGYLTVKNGIYYLTFRAIVYSQTSPSLTQAAKDEFEQYVRSHWWKALGVLILTVTVISVLASVVTINIMTK